LQRVVTVVSQLSAAEGSGCDAADLARAAGYGGNPESQREQLARDIRTLVRQGWEITNIAEPGSGARYRLEPGDPRVRLAFDQDERAEFERAAEIAGVSGSQVAQSLDAADRELRRAVRSSAAYQLELVLHGHEHRCLLHFTYRDRSRTVSSDAVWLESDRWYLVGRQLDDEEPRNFRIDRIAELHLDRPGSAGEAQPGTSLRIDPLTYADGPELLAQVAVHPDHRRRAERSLGPARDVARDADELVLTIPVVSRQTFVRRLCEMGERARLLGPPELRDELRGLLGPHIPKESS